MKTTIKINKQVKKQIKKININPDDLIEGTKKQVSNFKKEFQKYLLVGLTSAFGFLIALSWRTPIQKSVIALTKRIGLNESLIYFEYLAAIIITIIAVIMFMVISKFKVKEKKVKKEKKK